MTPRRSGGNGQGGLTRERFEALLARLAPDREQAGECYEDIRRRLVRLFEWRGYAAPEDLADEAIDRGARRLEEGTEVRDGFAYFRGVAHRVAQEMFRERKRERDAFSTAADLAAVDAELEADAERRRACLNSCLGRLKPDQRRLILDYYQGSRHIDSRQRLAHELGIAMNALRIRAHRVRRTLADCCARCLAEGEKRGR